MSHLIEFWSIFLTNFLPLLSNDSIIQTFPIILYVDFSCEIFVAIVVILTALRHVKHENIVGEYSAPISLRAITMKRIRRIGEYRLNAGHHYMKAMERGKGMSQ